MRKIIFFTLGMFFLVQMSFAQEEPEIIINREYSSEIDRIFGKLELNRIPHGLLENASFPYTDLEAYNGIPSDSTQITVEVFSNIYKTLMSARMTPATSKDFKDLEQIAYTWSTHRTNQNTDETDMTLVLSGLYYKYAVISEQAVINGKIDSKAGYLSDVYESGVWQNPYEEKETVAIAPPESVLNTLSFSVMLPQDLFLTNDTAQGIVNIEADFKDGNGFRAVNFNNKIPLAYSSEGTYKWRFRLEKWDGQFIEIDVPILITDPVFPLPGTGKNNVVISNGNYDATLRIDYAPGSNNKIMRPLIVAEGFDPESVLKPEKIGGSVTLNNFLESIGTNNQLNNLLKTSNQQYDIIYVDWKNGVGDIKENAETLIKVIEWVNNEKSANGSTHSNVVVGQSMGGMVASYALRKMENTAGKDHQTSLYIAHDTPFQGANTPVSTQYLFRHLGAVYQSNPFAVFTGEILIPFIQDLSSMMGGNFLSQYQTPGTALGIQDAPAALQMTKYHVTPTQQVTTAHFDNWKSQFDAMGYPQQTRNVAVSNGNMCAEPQEVAGGEHMFLLNGTYGNTNLLNNVLAGLGATLWGITSGNWQLSLVSLIPGSSEVNYTVDLRAVPEPTNGTRLVYEGKVRYYKHVIRWFWGSNWTVATDAVPHRQNNVSASVLPIETFSGGTNNLESSVNGFVSLPPGTFVNPRYGFIPVASSLDISRSNAPMALYDFRRAYNDPDNLGDINLSTPFENFVTERTVGTRDNFNHISFSVKNSNWMAEELNADRNNTTDYPGTDCAFACSGMEIFGADFICDSQNYTYSIPEFDDVNISWSVNGLQIVSGQGTSNLVVKNNGGLQNKQVSVTISSAECGSVTLQKGVFAGVPFTMTGGITGPTLIYKSANQNFSPFITYTAPTAMGATHYEWELPGNFEVVPSLGGPGVPQNWRLQESTANSNEITAQSNLSTNGLVRVRACNECGCNSFISLQVNHHIVTHPGYEITPNPVSDGILNISLQKDMPVPSFTSTNVSIYDLQAKKVHDFIMAREGGSTNISHLPNGIYKVHIDMQNGGFEVLNLSVSK